MNGYWYCLLFHGKGWSYPYIGSNYTCKTSSLCCLPWGGGGSSCTISSKTYHLLAVIFTGANILQKCHEVVRCWSLNVFRDHMGVFVVHFPLPIFRGVLCIYFVWIFLYGSIGIVSQIFRSFQIFLTISIKILIFEPIILFNQSVVYNFGINTNQFNCVEHYWHLNEPPPNRINIIKNQLVWMINSKHPIVVNHI